MKCRCRLYRQKIKFDSEFQKEAFYRYLKTNGLDEDTVLEANTDWNEVLEGLSEADRQQEMPRKLPAKYSGDIFDELHQLYIDFVSLGVFSDVEVYFEDISKLTRWFNGDNEISFETVRVLKEIGYELIEISVEGINYLAVR